MPSAHIRKAGVHRTISDSSQFNFDFSTDFKANPWWRWGVRGKGLSAHKERFMTNFRACMEVHYHEESKRDNERIWASWAHIKSVSMNNVKGGAHIKLFSFINCCFHSPRASAGWCAGDNGVAPSNRTPSFCIYMDELEKVFMGRFGRLLGRWVWRRREHLRRGMGC